jgi:predicted O-methyltransferase YrrM/DNA-binding HxlR family transcriptional regulator
LIIGRFPGKFEHTTNETRYFLIVSGGRTGVDGGLYQPWPRREGAIVNHEEVMAEARSFMQSRAILTAAELDLFTHLGQKPSSADEMADRLGLEPKALTRLLDCLVILGLMEKEQGPYSNTEKGALLSANHPETVLPMVLHMNHIWNNWSGLTERVRKGQDTQTKPGLKFDKKSMKAFIGAMHVAAKGLSLEIAETFDLTPFQKLLDIGGASGTYTMAFLRKNPKMKAVIFDLEEVIPLARERLQEEGLMERVEFVSGDFYQDELPKGCDLALLSAIIHQNSPDENDALFQKVHRALNPGGIILIRDHIMEESRTRPASGAIFALNMLVNTRGGDTYTFIEVKDSLEKAGFKQVKLIRSGDRMDCLVEGTA